MGVELGLHFLGQRRALFLFGFFQSMPRTVLGGLFILRLTGEGFAGLAEFYDVVIWHLINAARSSALDGPPYQTLPH